MPQTVDYAALAEQARKSTPPVDYAALAEQARAEGLAATEAARIAKLVFYLGVEVANTQERPRWNPDSYARIATDRPRS